MFLTVKGLDHSNVLSVLLLAFVWSLWKVPNTGCGVRSLCQSSIHAYNTCLRPNIVKCKQQFNAQVSFSKLRILRTNHSSPMYPFELNGKNNTPTLQKRANSTVISLKIYYPLSYCFQVAVWEVIPWFYYAWAFFKPCSKIILPYLGSGCFLYDVLLESSFALSNDQKAEWI